MPVILQNQVVDHLRAARAADDVVSRLQENSWETTRKKLVRIVESANWRHGPAELLGTFDHHLVVRDPAGSMVRVEWTNTDTGVKLGKPTIFESATPVADLGHEVMETAKAAVDRILDEDYDAAAPMIASITEALDTGGDLQRRIVTEVTIRSLTRDAWWHRVVGLREGIEDKIPVTVDDIQRSATDLLVFLKEQASALATAARRLASTEYAFDVEALARDLAEDVERAITALMDLDRRNVGEVTQVYEAVATAAPQLLNGIAFLNELTEADVGAVQGETT